MIAIDNYQLYWLEIMETNMFMATEMAKFDEVI